MHKKTNRFWNDFSADFDPKEFYNEKLHNTPGKLNHWGKEVYLAVFFCF